MEEEMDINILKALYLKVVGKPTEQVTVMPQAGSSRQYVRLNGTQNMIGVYGTSTDENKSFISISSHFHEAELPVPEVYAVSEDFHYYLQEDLGTVSLFDAIAHGRKTGSYAPEEVALLRKTICLLPALQFKGDKGFDYSTCYPQATFNTRSVLWDLNYFKYCYLKALNIDFQEDRLEDDFQQLAADLTQVTPLAFLYRDFQSRNVMLRNNNPWFIDFQGGRKGPIHYDVVSLLWQAKARIPHAIKMKLIDAYLEELKAFIDIDKQTFMQQLDLFVLFRTLQVLGAYGFRGNFERKPHFLESIPFAIENLKELLASSYDVMNESSQDVMDASSHDVVSGPFAAYPYLIRVLQCVIEKESQKIFKKKKKKQVEKKAEEEALTIQITSFSYKQGIPADESANGGGFVFDCRAIHNPGRYEQYKAFTGMDQSVIDFLDKEIAMTDFLAHVYGLVDSAVTKYLERGFNHLVVSFGCTGGQHRSVYSAEHLAKHLHTLFGVRVKLVHREQHVERLMCSTR